MNSTTIKLLSSLQGRDKLNRFLQYSLKTSENPILKDLSTELSQTRQIMRLFQFLENILVAKQAARQKDDLVKILTILKTTGYGGWLVFDLILFCNNFKIYISSDQKGIVKKSNQFWLLGLVSSLLLGAYQLSWNRIRLGQEASLKGPIPGGIESMDEYKERLRNLKAEKKTLSWNALQDIIDVLIPAANLGYINLDQRKIGVVGSITSLMGLYTVFQKLK